jgi:hypothetical protein
MHPSAGAVVATVHVARSSHPIARMVSRLTWCIGFVVVSTLVTRSFLTQIPWWYLMTTSLGAKDYKATYV